MRRSGSSCRPPPRRGPRGRAFEGADQLLLVSANEPDPDRALALHRTAVEAAVTAGAGRILYTSHQAAASDSPYDGPTTLTAGAAPTFEEIAEIASELTGHTVELVVTDEEEWMASQLAQGTQEFMARFQLGFYRTARQGGFASVDPLLGKLLGREPQTARDVLSRPTG